jgi:hypothetical protein
VGLNRGLNGLVLRQSRSHEGKLERLLLGHSEPLMSWPEQDLVLHGID